MITIGNNGGEGLSRTSVSKLRGIAADEATSSEQTGSKSDSVNLSNAAELIRLAKTATSPNQLNLQALSATVRSGQYRSEPAQISRAIVEGHLTT